jgi:bifunctional DNase/RNase
MNNKERLYYFSCNRLTGTDDVCIIALLDESAMREISIVCEKGVAVLIELYLTKPDVLKTSLVNALVDIVEKQTDFHFEIDIEGLDDGVYITYLVNTVNGARNRIKASEAVYLSLVSDVPIYITYELMKTQSVRHREKSDSLALPVNAVSVEMLQKALDKAVKDENYELASRLRDEMQIRKNKEDKTGQDERG